MAEMLARYFTNADHVSNLTEEDDSFRTIREVYRETNSDVGRLKYNRHLKRSTQRNLVDETSGSHRSFLRMRLIKGTATSLTNPLYNHSIEKTEWLGLR